MEIMLNILKKLWNYLEKIICRGSQMKNTTNVNGEMNINENSKDTSYHNCKVNNVKINKIILKE